MLERSSGILLHITSLPGPYYNGDLGKEAYRFVDLLAAAGQTWWQLLPVNPIGLGYSPYSTVCSFAGEPILIDLIGLKQAGLLTAADIKPPENSNGRRVRYRQALAYRHTRLQKAYERYLAKKGPTSASFRNFCKRERAWLDDYALYMVACDRFKTQDWTKWPQELRRRERAALKSFTATHAVQINYHKFLQLQFFTQWQQLRRYAEKKRVKLIGDIPIFVSHWSSDVWAHQEQFQLDKQGCMTAVAGVPPDFFNRDGQRWGNALYKWPVMQKKTFSWWCDRFATMDRLFHLVRLDHFIGFYRYWQIPASHKNAKGGRWRRSPGEALLKAVRRRLGRLPVIAEDLGVVIPAILKLRDDFGIPGMRITQLAFGADADAADYHMPHSYPENSVVCTATHDFPTARGSYDQAVRERRAKKPHYSYERFQTILNTRAAAVHWDMICTTLASRSDLAIILMQDWLGLGASGRMNTPGVADGNWTWRFERDTLTQEDVKRLKNLTTWTGRC